MKNLPKPLQRRNRQPWRRKLLPRSSHPLRPQKSPCPIIRNFFYTAFGIILGVTLCAAPLRAREMESFPIVKLQSLDKVTARSMTFEARVGSTVKFGPLYIKVQSCQKAPPVEQPEAAAFLQIWQVNAEDVAEWVFSGWMFASSPALSFMDHPIYDVWVLDCLERKSGEAPPPDQQAKEGEGELPAGQAPAEPGAEKSGPETPAVETPVEEAPEPTSADDGDLQME